MSIEIVPLSDKCWGLGVGRETSWKINFIRTLKGKWSVRTLIERFHWESPRSLFLHLPFISINRSRSPMYRCTYIYIKSSWKQEDKNCTIDKNFGSDSGRGFWAKWRKKYYGWKSVKRALSSVIMFFWNRTSGKLK